MDRYNEEKCSQWNLNKPHTVVADESLYTVVAHEPETGKFGELDDNCKHYRKRG